MPFSWVPRKIQYESCVKDPIKKGRLTWCRRLPGDFESCPWSLLGEHSDWAEVGCGDFDGLVGRRSDAASGRDLMEFEHCGYFASGLEDKVDPV